MATLAVLNTEGKEVEKIDLSDAIFGVEINETLVHKAVVTYLANNRQGTQSALTRAEVSGGGKKPWRQKGTGHARQGSTRSPQWTGGGVVFAPKPRDYAKKMNKREKQIALFSALTSKVQDEKLIVLDALTMDAPKTSAFAEILDNLKVDNALVVTKDKEDNVVLSARNIPAVATTISGAINVYDILKYETLIMTKDAARAIEEVYA
ncbi:MAG: 50S ribosomal protein L4 [Eubacterium sp.]|nr:50S ribosomal protein L4 [Eubacterium sp.]